MGYLLYLIFRCDFDVMENLESLEELGELNTALASTVNHERERDDELLTTDERVLHVYYYKR